MFAWVALGGAAGAMARYGVGLATVSALGPRVPWGTLVVNVVGSAALGAALEGGTTLSPGMRLMWTTGFLGAFTTFSTFSVETVRLVERGALSWAAASVLGNVVLGLLGAGLGIAAVRWMRLS